MSNQMFYIQFQEILCVFLFYVLSRNTHTLTHTQIRKRNTESTIHGVGGTTKDIGIWRERAANKFDERWRDCGVPAIGQREAQKRERQSVYIHFLNQTFFFLVSKKSEITCILCISFIYLFLLFRVCFSFYSFFFIFIFLLFISFEHDS